MHEAGYHLRVEVLLQFACCQSTAQVLQAPEARVRKPLSDTTELLQGFELPVQRSGSASIMGNSEECPSWQRFCCEPCVATAALRLCKHPQQGQHFQAGHLLQGVCCHSSFYLPQTAEALHRSPWKELHERGQDTTERVLDPDSFSKPEQCMLISIRTNGEAH